jgi:chromosome partitioning protein
MSIPAEGLTDSRAVSIVSVLALKGGVGKTSVVLGLAGAATVRGLAVLVIDLDPQGNATSILAATKPKGTAADVLTSPTRTNVETALTACAWEIPPGEVDVIPSSPELIRHDAWTGRSWTPTLHRAMSHLEGYDLILIDCPPSLGALTREALSASRKALVVTAPSYFGSQGVEKATTLVDEVRRQHNRDLVLHGIVVNRLRTSAEEHTYRVEELADVHGRRMILPPPIPERIAVQQAEGMGAPVQTVSTAGGRELSRIFDQHLTRLLRS